MGKNFVVIMILNKDATKLLLVKRNKKPYKNCWNGVGGKIEAGETSLDAATRECLEETGIILENPKLLMTYIYPESNVANPGTHLNVVYDFITETKVSDNEEGHYEWKNLDFVMDIDNKEIAGFSNLNQFIKEILDQEKIKKFYE